MVSTHSVPPGFSTLADVTLSYLPAPVQRKGTTLQSLDVMHKRFVDQFYGGYDRTLSLIL